MYAIVESGGKQYKVQPGDLIDVELLPAAPGDTVELDQVLLIFDDDTVTVGKPVVEGARVRATVIKETKGKKVVIFMYRPKKRIRQKTGHRQRYTRLQIEEIVA
jgi:large subunit ribosomal protein L21